MKYLNVVWVLSLFFSIEGLCQNIEVPETVITGRNRAVYKTPLFFYQHEVQVKFPEVKKIQPQTTTKQPVQQEKIESEKKEILSEFSLLAGKFGQIYSDLIIRSAETDMHLSLFNDDSFRTNDSTEVIDFSLKKKFSKHILFNIDYRNIEKEMPGSIYQPLNRKKHTAMLRSDISFSNQNYATTISGAYNSLDNLEEKKELFIFKKYCGNLTIGAEIGYDDFAGEGNKILGLSGGYENENYQIGLSLRTIGNQTKILPSAMIKIQKDRLSFSTGILGDFSFPDFWEKAGDSSYLNIKNTFLSPEEKYWLYSMLVFDIADTQFSFNTQLSYEKTSYHWTDPDNDNLYEPGIIKNNVSTSYGMSLTKKMGHLHIETGFIRTIREKQVSGFPEETGYVKARFETGRFTPEIELNYTGRQRFDTAKISSHTLLSVLLPYNINPDMIIFCKFNNILGYKYNQAPGYPGRPFEVVAGFHVKW